MINRLLSFLDASPVNFLAVKNIADMLEAGGFRRLDPCQPCLLARLTRATASLLPRTTRLYLPSALAPKRLPMLVST